MWRKSRKRKGNQKGVTLFEVMIALALFAVIITPVMRSFITAMKVNQRSRETMIATDVAQSIMEGISGKTYAEVCKALEIAPVGFDFQAAYRDQSGKYALSSINDGYYNAGIQVFEVPDFPASVSGIDTTGKNLVWPAATLGGDPLTMDKAMAINALTYLQVTQADEDTWLQPYDDSWTNDGLPNDTPSPDKCLFFGHSDETYGGLPMVTYMLYTRIQKDNQFFDATVTFIPRSHDINVAAPGDNDEFFTYEVTVSVYPYDYDVRTGKFINRFDNEYYIVGAPAAVMKSGIQNKK